MTMFAAVVEQPENWYARFENPIPETQGFVDVPLIAREVDPFDGIMYGLVHGDNGSLIAAEEDDDFLGYVQY